MTFPSPTPVSVTNNDPNKAPNGNAVYQSSSNQNFFNVFSTTPDVFSYLTISNPYSPTSLVTVSVAEGTISLTAAAGASYVTVISSTQIQFQAQYASTVFNTTTPVLLYTPPNGISLGISPDLVTVYVAGDSIGRDSFTDTYYIQCFVPGTMIAVPDGERAIETLAVGDMVLTAKGDAAPVRFIGHRALDLTSAPEHSPVLIPAGALADGIPSRDLRVSPDHAIAIDGVLVTARALLGGAIRQENVDQVMYYHIQLDGHEVIIADGTPCETLLDGHDPVGFDNANEAVITDVFLAPCLPRMSQGEAVEAIRAKIRARTSVLV